MSMKAQLDKETIQNTESRRPIFPEEKLLTLPSVYILKCITFVKKNKHCIS